MKKVKKQKNIVFSKRRLIKAIFRLSFSAIQKKIEKMNFNINYFSFKTLSIFLLVLIAGVAHAVTLSDVSLNTNENFSFNSGMKIEKKLMKTKKTEKKEEKKRSLKTKKKKNNSQIYFITGYQAVNSQTDDTPEIAAWGDNIKGGLNVAAVTQDSHLRRGTCLKISGLKGTYIVLDRLNKKFNGKKKIDILVKTKKEAYRITRKRKVQILPAGSCNLKRLVDGKVKVKKFKRKGRFKLK